MLYYLFQWLDKYDFPGAGMFGYTSFRSLMAIILALLISSIWGDKFINLLKRKQITETQRGSDSHKIIKKLQQSLCFQIFLRIFIYCKKKRFYILLEDCKFIA